MFGQNSVVSSIDDGPYVFKSGDQWLIRWVDDGIAKKKQLTDEGLSDFVSEDARYFDPNYLISYHESIDDRFQFDEVSHIAVISDVHGQYSQMVKMLQANGIIDHSFNWKFGIGHLVVLGDIMDRGDFVQECLWLLFKLEQQAASEGGKVNILLGNHEVMVLQGDHRYVHKKYQQISEELHTPYDELFGKDSVLGDWLRTKPAVIGINNILFVHAGISPELIKAGFSIEEINHEFRKLLDFANEQNKDLAPRLKKLHGPEGPMWHRGLVYDPDFTVNDFNEIVAHFDKQLMVVGHTTMPKIEPKYDGKLYMVDTGVKYGYGGELLLFENGRYFSGDDRGKRRQL